MQILYVTARLAAEHICRVQWQEVDPLRAAAAAAAGLIEMSLSVAERVFVPRGQKNSSRNSCKYAARTQG